MRLSILTTVLTAVLTTVSAFSAKADEAGVLLAEEGEPRAVLVLPAAAGRRSVERQSAELLQDFIQRMSGAELPVFTADEAAIWHQVELAHEGMNFVLVGAEDLAGQLGIEKGDIGPGGLRVKTFGNGVALLGGPERVEGERGTDDAGVRHAAIELLERLGCRYLWPGELGLVVPDRPTVIVPETDYSFTPQVRRRGLRWGRMRGRAHRGLDALGMEFEQWEEGWNRAMGDADTLSWLAWNRLGGSMRRWGHGGAGLRDGARHLEENPEWFALQGDGTRDQGGDSRWRLCKSNPDLIEHVAKDIIRRRNENPDMELVSLCPNDGASNTGWCMCDDCVALDPPHGPTRFITSFGDPVRPGSRRRERNRVEHVSLTDRLVFYWNSIAERVAEVHPDLRFGVSAYSAFSYPPVERELHPNLAVRYVPSTTEHLEGWIEAGMANVFWRPNILLANRRHGKLRSIVGRLAENMSHFARAGMNQTDFDNVNHFWSTLGLSYYAAARLNWDSYMPAEAIIEDYARHGFGDGAEHVRRYFERVEELDAEGIVGRFRSEEDMTYTPEVMAELRALLNAAEEAADDETISERIAFLRLGLNFTELQERLDLKVWRRSEGMDYDRELGQRLVDLNCLALRDIVLNHNLAIRAPSLVSGTGTFARFSAIGGRTVTPSSPALLERVGDPEYGLDGREQSLDDLFAAFGLTEGAPSVAFMFGGHGGRGRADARRIERQLNVEGGPFYRTEYAGPWIDPADFPRYDVVVIATMSRGPGEDRPYWSDEHIENVLEYVRSGGHLVMMANSPYQLAHEGVGRGLRRLEPLLGGAYWGRGSADGELLADDHPATEHLAGKTYDWFSSTANGALTRLTTARPLVGTENTAWVAVNQVGQGQVVYLGHPTRNIGAGEERDAYCKAAANAILMGNPAPVEGD